MTWEITIQMRILCIIDFRGACSLVVTGEKIKAMFYSQQRSFFPSLSFSGCEIFNESTGSERKLSRKGLCNILNFVFSLKCQMEPCWQEVEDLLSVLFLMLRSQNLGWAGYGPQ